MRSLILSFLFVAISLVSFGQTSELCLTAEGAPTPLVPAPSVATTLNIDPTWTANTDAYTPPNFVGPYSVAYWSFTVDASQYYTFNIETSVGMPIATDVSVALSNNSLGSACPIDATLNEIYSGLLTTVGSGTPVIPSCNFLTAGTTYTVAVAVATGNEGDVVLTVIDATGASNQTCDMAISVPAGPIP